MSASIIIGVPPNFAELAVAFPWIKTMPNIIYSWENKIYNPDNTPISSWLKAHENVHAQAQIKMGVLKWWDQYIKSVDFRFGEEVPAHHAEYKQFCALVKGAHQREAMLNQVTERLSGVLYGDMVPFAEARRLVRLGKT